MSKYFRELSVAAALGVLLIILAKWGGTFFAKNQLLTTLMTGVPVLLVACGMTLVIVCRQIDVSVGAQFAWCSILVGLMAKAGMPMPVVAFGAAAVGALLGAVNGAFVAWLGLPSIVVTLATMVTWRETLLWWRQGELLQDLPDGFQWFGLSQGNGQAVILSATFAIFLALTFIMKHLAIGRFVYAVGSDAEAARLAGINPKRVTFGVFVTTGALTGIAALLNAVRFPDITPKTGTGLELQAIAAAVVGGVAISGGRGRLWGVFAGVFLLVSIAPALVNLKLPPPFPSEIRAEWEKAIQGMIILLAVAADGFRAMRAKTHAV